MEENDVEMPFERRLEKDRDIAVGMETARDRGAAGAFDPQALGADGDSLGGLNGVGGEAEWGRGAEWGG